MIAFSSVKTNPNSTLIRCFLQNTFQEIDDESIFPVELDEGFLYFIDAQTGAVIWKFRGAPAECPDRRQLGNEHLVSFWPVRGGQLWPTG
jgi:hypothetical protein